MKSLHAMNGNLNNDQDVVCAARDCHPDGAHVRQSLPARLAYIGGCKGLSPASRRTLLRRCPPAVASLAGGRLRVTGAEPWNGCAMEDGLPPAGLPPPWARGRAAAGRAAGLPPVRWPVPLLPAALLARDSRTESSTFCLAEVEVASSVAAWIRRGLRRGRAELLHVSACAGIEGPFCRSPRRPLVDAPGCCHRRGAAQWSGMANVVACRPNMVQPPLTPGIHSLRCGGVRVVTQVFEQADVCSMLANLLDTLNKACNTPSVPMLSDDSQTVGP